MGDVYNGLNRVTKVEKVGLTSGGCWPATATPVCAGARTGSDNAIEGITVTAQVLGKGDAPADNQNFSGERQGPGLSGSAGGDAKKVTAQVAEFAVTAKKSPLSRAKWFALELELRFAPTRRSPISTTRRATGRG